LNLVGTARCAVRAAFSGASTGRGRLMGQRVPPAARGRGRRSAASLPIGVRKVEGDSDRFMVPRHCRQAEEALQERSRPAGPPEQFPSREGSRVGSHNGHFRFTHV